MEAENITSLFANHHDISSYSNFDTIRQESIKINAYVDFNKSKVSGSVEISFRMVVDNETRIILDSKNVEVFGVKDINSGKVLKWSFYKENADREALGTPLVILLDSEVNYKINDVVCVLIDFSSTDRSDAIQWFNKEQTRGKNYPFMFTQCEAILARTIFPCQDSPSAKVTVEAVLSVDKPLRVLFSGIEISNNETEIGTINTYHYVQKIVIPTYLIAIAAGELEYGKLSERCGVWTEVGLRDKAVWEFAQTEEYLKTAEDYLTPYVWGVYNILVLPFAFPYGGMENPCLTFVTPALLAGDRSMTFVIAHEIAHSWTGNLVTNKDWTNFWMNEGFTVFMERKICELMDGEEMANLEASVGKGELAYAIESIGKEHSFTSLTPDMRNIDPDDAFSTVPYEKGFTFLYFLETIIGKTNFQKIFQGYIHKFALKSVSWHCYKQFFEEQVAIIYGDKSSEILNQIDWDSWIKTVGFPFKEMDYPSKLIDHAKELAEQFINNTQESTAREIFKNWHSNVRVVFLNYLNENHTKVSDICYTNLRDLLGLHGEEFNAEVKYIWYQIALKTRHEDVVEHVKKFLGSQGRMKYIRPVYYAWVAFQKEHCLNYFDQNK